VTAGRGTPLPVTSTWSYPGEADVVGWTPLFESLTAGAPVTGTVGNGTVYAGYAPAGSFTVTSAGRTAVRRPAFGWAGQYQVTAGTASLQLSQFPLVPLAVLLELLAWVVLVVALLGRPRLVGAPRHGRA
jgi:hypothetical protein